MDQYIKDGKIERIIKLYDKDKPGLRKGSVLHNYINYKDSKRAKEDVDYYSRHLDKWGNLPEEHVAAFAEEKREAKKQDNAHTSQAIIEEAKKLTLLLFRQ